MQQIVTTTIASTPKGTSQSSIRWLIHIPAIIETASGNSGA